MFQALNPIEPRQTWMLRVLTCLISVNPRELSAYLRMECNYFTCILEFVLPPLLCVYTYTQTHSCTVYLVVMSNIGTNMYGGNTPFTSPSAPLPSLHSSFLSFLSSPSSPSSPSSLPLLPLSPLPLPPLPPVPPVPSVPPVPPVPLNVCVCVCVCVRARACVRVCVWCGLSSGDILLPSPFTFSSSYSPQPLLPPSRRSKIHRHN